MCQTPDADLYPECSQTDPDGDTTTDPTIDETTEEVDILDDGSSVEDNSVPYFADYDPFNVYEVTRYDELIVQLPEIRDDNENDIVTVSATLTAPQ